MPFKPRLRQYPNRYLEGGFEAWLAAGEDIDVLEEVSANEFAQLFENNALNVLDVRRASEYDAEHLAGSTVQNFPLDFINRNMNKLNATEKYYLHCAGGYRSVIAASILKARGFENIVNIQGGYKALSATVLKRTDFVPQITEL